MVQGLGSCASTYYGSFRKLGVPHFGVPIIRILLVRYYIRVPYFRTLPYDVAFIEMVVVVVVQDMFPLGLT